MFLPGDISGRGAGTAWGLGGGAAPAASAAAPEAEDGGPCVAMCVCDFYLLFSDKEKRPKYESKFLS